MLTPTPPQSTPKSQSDYAVAVVQEFGIEALQGYTREFLENVNKINAANQALADAPELDQNDYDAYVGRIIEATSDYYTFIGKMPETVRRFFASFSGSDAPDDATIEKLSSMIGVDVKIEYRSPLSVQSIRPQKYIMQIDAITNRLATLSETNTINVGRKGSQPVTTMVTLDIPEHMKIEGGGALSTYDKSIINGVTSLIESGNTVFSVPMLYHAMTGKQNPTVDEQLSEEISQKLEKMRRMMITIDLSEEGSARYITDENGENLKVEDLTLEGYLMPLNRISGKINGKSSDLYQILQHPPLYSYSKMKRQLASVPISLLGAPINNNSTTIPLKTYLLQRIELMKNQKNNIVSNTILYDSIYKELGAENAAKTKKMRIRTYTETILDYFVENAYIKGYSQFKKGRNIAGIQIQL